MTEKLALRRPIIRLALSRTEVAMSIGVSAGSVDQMVREGVLPPPRSWHSRKLWLVSEVEASLNEWPIDGETPSEEVPWFEELNQPTKGAGGYQIPTSKNDPIQKYYDKLGFDPNTMDAADMKRLHAAAEAKWKASIPGTPLGRREQNALLQLSKHPVGELIAHNAIKGCGPDTADRLEARGFIEIRSSADRLIGYIFTADGFAASQGARS